MMDRSGSLKFLFTIVRLNTCVRFCRVILERQLGLVGAFQREQVVFGFQSTGKSGQAARRTNDPMARATIEIGFRRFAAPTARTALGLPICRAIWL